MYATTLPYSRNLLELQSIYNWETLWKLYHAAIDVNTKEELLHIIDAVNNLWETELPVWLEQKRKQFTSPDTIQRS